LLALRRLLLFFRYLPSSISFSFSCSFPSCQPRSFPTRRSSDLILYAGLIFLYSCISCTSQNKKVRLRVDVPIEGDKIVSIFNLSNGTQVYEDTLRGKLVLDSLTYGIHLLSIMWDRDIITPDAFKIL